MFSTSHHNGFTVKAYQGDAKTLLAFDLPEAQTKGLAGFTLAYTPPGGPQYFIYNQLTLQGGAGQGQVATEPAQSSANAPIQKFRWTHVPGNFHQGDQVAYGDYVYQITPRYFNPAGGLELMDPTLSVKVTIAVQPFVKGNVGLAFTRGFVQSQAFAHRFGVSALFKPKGRPLLFDTSTAAGTNSSGQTFSFAQEYAWCGSTARTAIFEVLNEVLSDKTLALDMLAYDLDEPDVLKILLQLATEGRISLILDNASLHHDAARDTPEDEFEDQFNKVKTGNAYCLRGKFGRFQHNKILIVKKGGKAIKALSGSTNFSVTGMYVNSNHVIIFNDPAVATVYSNMFLEAWNDKVSETAFVKSAESTQPFTLKLTGVSAASVTFAPHASATALANLQRITDRIGQETSSVLFAVMDTGPSSSGPLIPELVKLHLNQKIYNAGISDSTNNISLYKPNDPAGLAVTGKPSQVLLPPPFNKEASIGLGHQVHDKFIVCGFNTPSAVVWLGSSNLALGGEEQNGDNLIEIHDTDIATAFAIEAIDLVDHFNFRDTYSSAAGQTNPSPQGIALQASDTWAASYFDASDYHMRERLLFR
jgi:phosphatidylserine/phosphatidylglycerophosphate/cardiolipin synthase-like enzyme